MSGIYAGKIEILENFDSTVSMLAEEKINIKVKITNLSEQNWINEEISPLNLSYHWMKSNGEVLIWDGMRTPLLQKILPKKQSIDATILVSAPNEMGTYILVLTMVKEGVTWLENNAFVSASIEIQINRGSPEANFLLLGNCQAVELAHIFNELTSGVVQSKGIMVANTIELDNIKIGEDDIHALIEKSDVILIHSGKYIREYITERFPKARFKIKEIPRIIFSAFHPDLCQIFTKDTNTALKGVFDTYQSSLAFYGWLHGYTIAETLELFNGAIYQYLNYFDFLESSKSFLIEEGEKNNLPLAKLIEKWLSKGCWMHSINHPKLFVLIDIARAILARERVPIAATYKPSDFDRFGENGPVWPLYPGIAEKFKIEKGCYQFKLASLILDLEQFVSVSFELFSKYNPENLKCDAILNSRFQQLENFILKQFKTNNFTQSEVPQKESYPNNKNNNPYRALADYHFWRRSLELLPIEQVDPIVGIKFKINTIDKVATAGSCFAQHISKTLKAKGFNYFVSEVDNNLSVEQALNKNYGVFSARFGNIYTTRQLVQLFDRAYGLFAPIDNVWIRSDGKYIDPFRPQIEADGFQSIEELENSRALHFKAVRKMFEELNIFIFTLGLTESWRNKLDGAVYPLAPGVVAGEMLPNQHEFVNFSVAEIVADFSSFIEKLLKVNPTARIILTVSPVPLIATYENQHVLTATTYSKSVLRVAAQEIYKANEQCEYFPSYEIITGSYTRGKYFESDLRSVTQDGVDHVMRLFLQHYMSAEYNNSFASELKQMNTLLSEIICDEEAIVRNS